MNRSSENKGLSYRRTGQSHLTEFLFSQQKFLAIEVELEEEKVAVTLF